jgi:hypothetical protein
MGLFSRLFGRRGGGGNADRGDYVYIRCNGLPRRPCGEPIRVRLNLQNDPDPEYDEDGDRISGYTVHKDVLGNWCQNMIRLTIHYDADRRETGREAEGGTLIDQAEYERLKTEAEEVRPDGAH